MDLNSFLQRFSSRADQFVGAFLLSNLVIRYTSLLLLVVVRYCYSFALCLST